VSGARRALATRNRAWPRTLAGALGRAGVRPNAVSLAGIVFAAAAAGAFALVPSTPPLPRTAALVAAAALIQLRLLCNLLDGLLAVEEGLRTPTGDLFNELPDRLADVVILAGAGYAVRDLAGGVTLGWAAAACALMTAYVRALGGSLGLPQDFCGPMAKPHRMFTLTVAALAGAIESGFGNPPQMVRAGLVVIVVGSIVTIGRRTLRLAREVTAR
jgi:phosphatidylglycerophosphate synthase